MATFTLVLQAVLLSILSINYTEAWWGVGPLGGLGFARPWGGLGYGGLGYGGLGYGGLGYGGLGWGIARPWGLIGKRDINDLNSRVECHLSVEKQIMSCNGIVQCETIQQLEGLAINFDMFGVGLESNTLRLYAKNFTDVNFMTSMVGSNGNLVELSIYPTGVLGKSGLLVKDQVCYDKIMALFTGVKAPVTVDAIGNNIAAKITVSGFVL